MLVPTLKKLTMGLLVFYEKWQLLKHLSFLWDALYIQDVYKTNVEIFWSALAKALSETLAQA